MNYRRTILAAALTGAMLLGGFSSSAAELSIDSIEIISVGEDPAPEQTEKLPGQTELQIQTGSSSSKEQPDTEKDFPKITGSTKNTEAAEETKPSEKVKVSRETEAPKKATPPKERKVTGETAESEETTEPEKATEPEETTESEEITESEETEPEETEPVSETEPKAAGPIVTVPQGLYEIASAMNPEFVLDIRYCTVSDTDSKAVQLYRSLNVNQQKFYLEALPDSFYRISVLHTGDALTALPGDASSATAEPLTAPSGSVSSTTTEPLTDLSGSASSTTAESSAAPSGSASVVMAAMEHPQEDAASESQSWLLEAARSDSCYIRTSSGLYLSLASSSAYAGASVVLSEFTGEPSQMWKLDSTWSSPEACADTDLVNPYGEDGPYGHLELTLSFYGGSETLTAGDLAAHMEENGDHRFALETGYLDSYVTGLAEKYDTAEQTETFRTSSGKEITLYTGDGAWKLDEEGTKELLQRCLETDGSQTLSPVWVQRGQSVGDDIRKLYPATYGDSSKADSGNDNSRADSDEDRIDLDAIWDNGIGDSYLEVDLTKQKVFLYKDGELLLETDCVSGAVDNPKSCTPVGVYHIYYMNSPDTLDGEGYSEFVNYWMAFYGNYGLHDTTWREEFGGDIYLTDGSHGCLNLPLEAAEQIYNTIGLGFPVVLYK